MQEGIKVKKRGLLKKLGAALLTLTLAVGVLSTGMTARAEEGQLPKMSRRAARRILCWCWMYPGRWMIRLAVKTGQKE